MVFYSVNIACSRACYSTYDVEFYAIVQAIKHWRNYLFHQEFILYIDHDALKHLGRQGQDFLTSCFMDCFSSAVYIRDQASIDVDRHHRNIQFKVGDLVLAVLTQEHFAPSDYNKLK